MDSRQEERKLRRGEQGTEAQKGDASGGNLWGHKEVRKEVILAQTLQNGVPYYRKVCPRHAFWKDIEGYLGSLR